MRRANPIDEGTENLSRINRRRSATGVTFGDAFYRPSGSCGPRIQNDFQLVVVVSGSASVTVETTLVQIPAGSVALMLPGRREHFHFDRNHSTNHTWCAASPDIIPSSLAERANGAPQVQPLSTRLRSLLEVGFGVPHDPATGELLRALAIAAVEAYVLDGEIRRAGTRQSEPLQHALQHIESFLQDPLTVESLAHEAGVSPQHLIRLFRTQLGTTPARFLWRTRTERGIDLLRETGLGVAEISDRVGFQSPFHFSRLAKKLTGMSPRAIREQAWSLAERNEQI